MFLPFNAPVRVSGRRLTYTGRLTRARFLAWLDTASGQATVREVASHFRFAPFGRERAARRRLWREVAGVAGDGPIVDAVQREVDVYMKRVGDDLAFGDGLPRVFIDLHRLVVVPTVMINAAAYRGVEDNLRKHRATMSLEGGDRLRDFLFLALVDEIEEAVARAQPSIKDPLPAGEHWITVGLNRRYVWRGAMLDGPEWPGHHYVFELTRQPITRAIRKRVAEHIREFEASLPSLSVVERHEILRRANAA